MSHLLRQSRHAPRALVEEQTCALRRRSGRSQTLSPAHELPHQAGWFKGVCAAEGTSLGYGGSRFVPHQQLPIVQKWDRLQAIYLELRHRLGITGRVNEDGQVVRQDRLGARIQARLYGSQASMPLNRVVEWIQWAAQGITGRDDTASVFIDMVEELTEGGEPTGSVAAGGRHR